MQVGFKTNHGLGIFNVSETKLSNNFGRRASVEIKIDAFILDILILPSSV